MISTEIELKHILTLEKSFYISSNYKDFLVNWFCNEKFNAIWIYIKFLRKTEFHYNNSQKNVFHSFEYLFYRRLKNKTGLKLGIEIWENSFDKGLKIHHAGNIIVNGMARIGINCQLHGSNCIGNDGKSLKAPIIGDNVEIGVGAKIIGDVFIANNIKIGAGAIVISSFYENGITIAGVPAKKVK